MPRFNFRLTARSRLAPGTVVAWRCNKTAKTERLARVKVLADASLQGWRVTRLECLKTRNLRGDGNK